MANYLVTDTDLTSVADAIRTKGGTSAELEFPAGFVSAIGDIPTDGGGGLPNAYQEVEYIDSGNGGPYIITNYVPLPEDNIFADIWLNNDIVGDMYMCPFSAGVGTYQLIMLYGTRNALGRIYFKYFATGTASEAAYDNTRDLQKIVISPAGDLIINGANKCSSEYTRELDGNNTTLHVFIRANLDSRTAFQGKIGRLIVMNWTETKLCLIPCYRKADSVIGMYDSVSNIFYTNAGSGTFGKGDDILTDAETVSLLFGDVK